MAARWAVFAGVTAFVLISVLLLARVSHRPPSHGRPDVSRSLSAGALLTNVAVSQGVFLLVLVGGAWYARIPLTAFGIGRSTNGLTALAVGVAVGIVLYLATDLGSRVATAVGIDTGESLRTVLTPDSRLGWVALLGGVLPIIAVFEELLFRGALVGVLSTGFSVSPWFFVVISAVVFALGHGVQGRLGMAVTGCFGFVLGGVFVATGSFLVVVAAHYLTNALEFVVNEWLLAATQRV